MTETHPKRPPTRVLSNTAIWAASAVILLVSAASVVGLLFTLGNGNPREVARLEVIKTAGTIVLGTGGAAALLLTARRQRFTEIDLAYREEVSATTEHDATERRITELYTKAADQLGSDKAPVRLAGIYALERLAQNTVPQRQVVTKLLCAYLRMPYSPIGDTAPNSENKKAASPAFRASEDYLSFLSDAKISLAPPGVNEERVVRMAAQEVLQFHARGGRSHQQAVSTFWGGMEWDLQGATLLNFSLEGCTIARGSFQFASFHRAAYFRGVNMELAHFNHARFYGYADFREAKLGSASFDYVQFGSDASFHDAQFNRGGPGTFNTRVRVDIASGVRHIWPDGYTVVVPLRSEDRKLGLHDGEWGYLIRANDREYLPESLRGVVSWDNAKGTP